MTSRFLEPRRLGGLLLIVLGVAYSAYAFASYRLGTVSNMGPGMVPFGTGLLLLPIGAMVLLSDLTAARRSEVEDGAAEQEDSKPLAVWAATCIIASILAFAVSMRFFGVVPAIFVTVLISSLADGKFGLVRWLVISTLLSVFAVGVFGYMLNSNLPIARFPWPLW